MQVFGLPGHIIRNARGASRLLAAQTPDIEAARRRDALARWRRAMAQGLTGEQAAKAVGFPRSTLYRWQKRAAPLSRRPRRLRQPRRPEGLAAAVERCNGAWRYEFYACADLPMRIDKIAQMVEAFQHLYNHHRPHGALAGKTPAEYLATRRANETPQSHMS